MSDISIQHNAEAQAPIETHSWSLDRLFFPSEWEECTAVVTDTTGETYLAWF